MAKWLPVDSPEPCHRCGSFEDVREQYVVVNAMPCLAGSQRKVTVYRTWACERCWEEFRDRDNGEDSHD